MIIYDLSCEFGHKFEGWFKNPEDLQTQQANGLLGCPMCNSVVITKNLTASKLTKKSNAKALPVAVGHSDSKSVVSIPSENHSSSPAEFEKFQKILGEVHKFVDKNYTDVGNRFSEEAISIHRGDKEASNIRGTATGEQLKEMSEEGVKAMPLPPKPIDRKKIN